MNKFVIGFVALTLYFGVLLNPAQADHDQNMIMENNIDIIKSPTDRADKNYNVGVRHQKNGQFQSAFSIWESEAAKGHILSIRAIANLYKQGGLEFPQDLDEAISWYQKSHELGDSRAQRDIATIYISKIKQSSNHKEIIQWINLIDQTGDPQNYTQIGLLYLQGKGVPKSEKEALSWFEKAAGLKYKPAYDLIAQTHREGVLQDIDKSITYYQKLAYAGSIEAQNALAEIYIFYYKDYKNAYKNAYIWCNIAASSGNDEAKDCRNEVANFLDSKEVLDAQKASLEIWALIPLDE